MSRWMEYLRSAFWIALLVALFTTAFYVVERTSARRRSMPDHRISGFGKSGLRAWADLLRRQGFGARSFKHRLTALSGRHEALVILSPARHFVKDEVRALVEWVHSGGALLVAPSRHTLRSRFELYEEPIPPIQQILGPFGLAEQRETRMAAGARVRQYPPFTQDVESVYVPSHLRLEMADSDRLTEIYDKAAETPYFDYYLNPRSGAQPTTLAKINDQPSAVLVKYGQGWVMVLSEADMFANGWIEQADNAVLATNFAYLSGARTVHFDEYHKGLSLLSLQGLEAVSSRVWQILVMALCALGVFFVGRMIRFGRPVSLKGTPRHSAREVIDALAGLYRRAGATDAVVQTIGRRLRRKMARAARIPAGDTGTVADARLAAACARRYENLDEDTLTRLLSDFQAAVEAGRTLSDQQMLRLVRRAATVEKELDDRGG